jgi:adenosylcobinamide kinase / adenosylcobinamide-phosphate guanylyltransferase
LTLVVLLGGARAGKSALALELAERWTGPVAYIATAEARDEEMAARIERHRRERRASWTTIEEPLALCQALESLKGEQAAIVDCLTLWVANLLERGDDPAAIVAEAGKVAQAASVRNAPVIAVTNEVGLGIVPANALARTYREVLGEVNRAFVKAAESAAFVIAGKALTLDGATTLQTPW